MTDEAKALVERLRGGWNGWTTLTESEAADLIETQAREIERLTLTVRKLQGNQAALEAELAKFKALAETLAGALEAGTRFMPPSATVWHREAAKAYRQYKESRDER